MKRSGWLNLSTLVLVNFLWAAQYPAYKIASDHMDVAGLNFWMLVMAALLLVPLRIREVRRKPRVRAPEGWRAVRQFGILGVLGIVPPSVMLAWGVAHSSASNAAILSLTIPMLMIGLGVVMLGEKLTAIRVGSLAFALLGTLLVSIGDVVHASFDRRLLAGNLVIFLAGAGSAFYNTYSKELLERYSELEILLYSYSAAAVACAVISMATEKVPFYHVTGYPLETWAAIAFLGLFSWGIAMVLWMWVLNRLEVVQISASIYLLPLLGLLLSVAAVHEHIQTKQILGGALTLIGTIILTLWDRPSDSNESATGTSAP